jgi:hypothetical protein
MSASPIWKCEKCGELIRGNGGVVSVSYDDIYRYEQETEAFDLAHKKRVKGAAHAAGRSVNPFDYDAYDSSEFDDLPHRAHWHVLHDKCGAADIVSPYVIETGRIKTWHAVAHWTAHLFNKRWFESTDWNHTLERAGALHPQH